METSTPKFKTSLVISDVVYCCMCMLILCNEQTAWGGGSLVPLVPRLSSTCNVHQQGSLVSRASCIFSLAPPTRKIQLTTGQLVYYVELCTVVTDANNSCKVSS